MRTCVVIPAYNEEKRIGDTLNGLMPILKKGETRIIVVSDCSTDNTDTIVKECLEESNKISLIRLRKHSGKGAAVKAGFLAAFRKGGYDIIGFIDADQSVSGQQVLKLISAAADSKVDGVIGSRYADGSKILGNLTASRFIASRGYNAIVRLLFGFDFNDTQCGAKFFKTKAVKAILQNLVLQDLSFDINLLYEMKLNGSRIKEIPITYRIINNHSKVSIKKDFGRMFFTTVSYRLSR